MNTITLLQEQVAILRHQVESLRKQLATSEKEVVALQKDVQQLLVQLGEWELRWTEFSAPTQNIGRSDLEQLHKAIQAQERRFRQGMQLLAQTHVEYCQMREHLEQGLRALANLRR